MKSLEVDTSVQAEQLKEQIDELLRLVEGGDTIEVINHGKVIARVVPTDKPQRANREELVQFFAGVDRLAAEISAHWQGNESAVDAVHDVRREL